MAVVNLKIRLILIVATFTCGTSAFSVTTNARSDSAKGEGHLTDHDLDITHEHRDVSGRADDVSYLLPRYHVGQRSLEEADDPDDLESMSSMSNSQLDAGLLHHLMSASNATVCGILVDLLAELNRIESVCKAAFPGALDKRNSMLLTDNQSEEKRSWLDRGLANKVRLQAGIKRSGQSEADASRFKRSWLDRSLLLVGREKRSWLDRSLLDQLVDDLGKTPQVRTSHPFTPLPTAIVKPVVTSESHVMKTAIPIGHDVEQETGTGITGILLQALRPAPGQHVGNFLLRMALLKKHCDN